MSSQTLGSTKSTRLILAIKLTKVVIRLNHTVLNIRKFGKIKVILIILVASVNGSTEATNGQKDDRWYKVEGYDQSENFVAQGWVNYIGIEVYGVYLEPDE